MTSPRSISLDRLFKSREWDPWMKTRICLDTTIVSCLPLFFLLLSSFFSFFLFFISSPSPLFRPLVRPKNGGCYIDAWIDCSLASRYTDIQLIILVHTGEVSACDKSVNRWTPAERDGTRQTIRFPSMKFLRTKANTLFFQPEPSDFNFELASQRGVPARLSSLPVIDQTPILPIDYYIVLRIYTTPASPLDRDEKNLQSPFPPKK